MHAPNQEMHVVDTLTRRLKQHAQGAKYTDTQNAVAALQRARFRCSCKNICCTDTALETFLSNISFHEDELLEEKHFKSALQF